MSGPPRVPTDILKKRGSWLAPTRKDEPKPEGKIPPPPKWLDKSARLVYRRIVKELIGMKVGRSPDVFALCRYCRNWVRWKQADIFIRKYGESYPLKERRKEGKNEKGEWIYTEVVKCFVQFPQVAILNKLEMSLSRLEQQFGLTPAARAKINVEVPTTEKPEGKGRFFKTG